MAGLLGLMMFADGSAGVAGVLLNDVSACEIGYLLDFMEISLFLKSEVYLSVFIANLR